MKTNLWCLFSFLALVIGAVAQTPAGVPFAAPQVKTVNAVLEGALEDGNVFLTRYSIYVIQPT